MIFRGALIALLLFSTSVIDSRGADAAEAPHFLLYGGLALTSPRTAYSTSLPSYIAVSAALGLNFRIRKNFCLEPNLMLLRRRYQANSTVLGLVLPILAQYRTRYFYAGGGFYLGDSIGVSNDQGTPTSLEALGLNSLDFGIVFQSGFRLPINARISLLLDGRAMRPLVSSSSFGGFYFNNLIGFVGVEIDTAARPMPARR